MSRLHRYLEQHTVQLEGSCHCGKVKFKLFSRHPYPFNVCYCSICRKTAGGGGYAINLGGDNGTLRVRGRKFVKVYRAMMPGERGGARQAQSGRASFLRRMWQRAVVMGPALASADSSLRFGRR